MGAMWCSGIVFFTCLLPRGSGRAWRSGKKPTPIRGLICSDYKWLPSVGWRGRTSGSVLSRGSNHHVNMKRCFCYSPRPETESSRPGAAGHSDATESFHCPKKTLLLCCSRDLIWDVWGKKLIMSSLFLSVGVEVFLVLATCGNHLSSALGVRGRGWKCFLFIYFNAF